jgi:hypothetical protein
MGGFRCGSFAVVRQERTDYKEYIAEAFQMPIIGRFGEIGRSHARIKLPLVSQSSHSQSLGKPTQNAIVKSFNARLRDTCLNQHWFQDLSEARQLIERWRIHYNEVRPHSSLKHLPPSVFAQKAA